MNEWIYLLLVVLALSNVGLAYAVYRTNKNVRRIMEAFTEVTDVLRTMGVSVGRLTEIFEDKDAAE